MIIIRIIAHPTYFVLAALPQGIMKALTERQADKLSVAATLRVFAQTVKDAMGEQWALKRKKRR